MKTKVIYTIIVTFEGKIPPNELPPASHIRDQVSDLIPEPYNAKELKAEGYRAIVT